MAPELLARLFQQRSMARLIRFDESAVPSAPLALASPELVARFVKTWQDELAQQRKLYLVADIDSGAPVLTVTGVLLLLVRPADVLPSAYVRGLSRRHARRRAAARRAALRRPARRPDRRLAVNLSEFGDVHRLGRDRGDGFWGLLPRLGQASQNWTCPRRFGRRLRLWLELERTRVPDGSAIAKAIDYSLRRWTGLGRFLLDGDVPLDNNHCENQMRPWCLGRRSWLFVGSQLAGERAAAVTSLLQSARLNGHDPWGLPQGRTHATADAVE